MQATALVLGICLWFANPSWHRQKKRQKKRVFFKTQTHPKARVLRMIVEETLGPQKVELPKQKLLGR
jgi:hypothetical protein